MTTNLATSLGVFGTALLLASVSSAQEQPEGLMKQDAATGGSTDVATSGFEAPVEAEDEDEDKDTAEANISAGALITTGNARSTAATAAAKYRLRRGPNQFSAVAAANYARAAADPDSDTETTVENFQGKVRFDRFVAEGVALFLAISGRRDRFQGLDLRLNVDPGVAYYFIDEKSQQLWVEGGYDLQYDVRRDENLAAAAAAGENLDKTETRHNARLFAGYDNNVSEDVSFNTGIEYLQDVQDTDNVRLNWDVGLSSSVGKGFSLATTFSLKYDNNPLPGVEKTDTITAISLVYTLL